jgi:hypothetical protein
MEIHFSWGVCVLMGLMALGMIVGLASVMLHMHDLNRKETQNQTKSKERGTR